MSALIKRISDYMPGGEAYHVARRDMPVRSPRLTHRHDFYEVFLVETGSMTHFINGTTERLETGHLVFTRPDDCHAFQADPATGCETVNVMFYIDTADYLVDRYGKDLEGRFFWSAEDMPHAQRLDRTRHNLASARFRELQEGPRGLIEIETFLLTLMTRLLPVVSSVRRPAPAWLTEACMAVRDPVVFRQGALGFISAAGRSHEHVCRVSKQVLGMTPSAYVNQVRLDYAADLLRSGDQPICDIAEWCGLENISHFYRLFRDRFGTTPRAFRQAQQRDPFEAA